MGRRVVVLQDRSNSIGLSRIQPWLAVCSRLDSGVGLVLGGDGCSGLGRCCTVVGWW